MKPQFVQGLAIALSTLAGFVDAQGYLALGGLFVAFMSGNSTVLGVAVGEARGPRTALAAGLVAAFVAGVMVGTWVGRPFGVRRGPVVLLVMAGMLAAAGGLHRAGLTVPAGLVAALAMGTEDTVFQTKGGPGMGLTYMTGTLVRLGQRLAEAAVGEPWQAVLADAVLWAGMVVGAALGTAVYQAIGLDGLWGAAAVALGMAGLVWVNLPRADAVRH